MFGGENVALVLRRKALAIVKGEFQRCVVRLKQDIWDKDFSSQFGMFAGMTRVLMIAHVIPRPSIEAALLHVGDVVGNKIIAKGIAFIHRTPELAGFGVHRQPYWIANAGSVHMQVAAVRIGGENVSTVLLTGMSVGIVHV